MVLIFILIGVLTAYFNHRNSKSDGTIEPEIKSQVAEVQNYVPKPLSRDATRLQRIAHWLGLEEG